MGTKALFAGALALATMTGATLALAEGSLSGQLSWEPTQLNAKYLVDETFSKKKQHSKQV